MKRIASILIACFLALAAHGVDVSPKFEYREGGIIRGPKTSKRIALEFTAHEYGDGGEIILDALARHQAKASFFFTGKILRDPKYEMLIRRIVSEGHYLGPHSDRHLLYCPWDGPKKTLITREVFRADLEKNIEAIERFGVARKEIRYFVPPFEWYNEEIVNWSKEMGLTLINFSPGTRSTADYTEDTAKNFISSEAIYNTILKKEAEDPNGLNGFLLLLHFGTSPKRTDKFYPRVDDLLSIFGKKGYEFVRVDKLLDSSGARSR